MASSMSEIADREMAEQQEREEEKFAEGKQHPRVWRRSRPVVRIQLYLQRFLMR